MGAPGKQYNASIFIKVVTRAGCEYDLDRLESQIRQADSENPWISTYVGGRRAPSIHWMSEIEVREGEWTDRLHNVEIRPPFMLAWEQLGAYERYGTALARRLAQIVDSEKVKVIRVDSRLVVNGTFSGGYDPGTLLPR